MKATIVGAGFVLAVLIMLGSVRAQTGPLCSPTVRAGWCKERLPEPMYRFEEPPYLPSVQRKRREWELQPIGDLAPCPPPRCRT